MVGQIDALRKSERNETELSGIWDVETRLRRRRRSKAGIPKRERKTARPNSTRSDYASIVLTFLDYVSIAVIFLELRWRIRAARMRMAAKIGKKWNLESVGLYIT